MDILLVDLYKQNESFYSKRNYKPNKYFLRQSPNQTIAFNALAQDQITSYKR